MSQKPNPWSCDYGWQTGGFGSHYEQSYKGSDSNTVYVKGACKNNGREGAQGGIGVHWRSGHDLNISDTYSGQQTNQRASLEKYIPACSKDEGNVTAQKLARKATGKK